MSTTGARKGTKLTRYDLIPAEPLRLLAEHYGKGAEKYTERNPDGSVAYEGARNWEKGYEWSKSFAAMQRHAWQFWSGEDIDEETGSPHLAAVAWHAFAMLEWATTHPDFDDRPDPRPKPSVADMAAEKNLSNRIADAAIARIAAQADTPIHAASWRKDTLTGDLVNDIRHILQAARTEVETAAVAA